MDLRDILAMVLLNYQTIGELVLLLPLRVGLGLCLCGLLAVQRETGGELAAGAGRRKIERGRGGRGVRRWTCVGGIEGGERSEGLGCDRCVRLYEHVSAVKESTDRKEDCDKG